MQRLLVSLFLGGSLLGGSLLYACAGGDKHDDHAGMDTMMNNREAISAPAGQKTASATIGSSSGSKVAGTATFTEENGKVTLVLELQGVTPAGKHAVHLHEFGDCSAPDAASAGGHWNPTKEAHGHWGDDPHHMGDIGNIEIAEDGTGRLTMTTDMWAIGGDDASKNILGKSVIVHDKPDDFKTQPTGAAGGRIGCGVISQ